MGIIVTTPPIASSGAVWNLIGHTLYRQGPTLLNLSAGLVVGYATFLSYYYGTISHPFEWGPTLGTHLISGLCTAIAPSYEASVLGSALSGAHAGYTVYKVCTSSDLPLAGNILDVGVNLVSIVTLTSRYFAMRRATNQTPAANA